MVRPILVSSVQVLLFHFQRHLIKILRPVAEGALLVEVRAVNLRRAILRISGKPVELDKLRR